MVWPPCWHLFGLEKIGIPVSLRLCSSQDKKRRVDQCEDFLGVSLTVADTGYLWCCCCCGNCCPIQRNIICLSGSMHSWDRMQRQLWQGHHSISTSRRKLILPGPRDRQSYSLTEWLDGCVTLPESWPSQKRNLSNAIKNKQPRRVMCIQQLLTYFCFKTLAWDVLVLQIPRIP